MRVGVLGPQDDARCAAMAEALRARGAEVVRINDDGPDTAASTLDGALHLAGRPVGPLDGLFVARVPSPWAPPQAEDETLARYEDWFIRSMQARERSSFLLAWLLSQEAAGVRTVNSPRALAQLEYVAHRQHVLRSAGARVPRTLISNDVDAVHAFVQRVGSAVSGGLLGEPPRAPVEAVEPLSAPRCFQERVDGARVEAVLVGEQLVGGPALPRAVEDACRASARLAGLRVAAFELCRGDDGEWTFLDVDGAPPLDDARAAAAAELAGA